MVATRLGYAGGTTAAPDYHHTGDHHESVEVTYDPTRTSYAALLAVFWAAHPAVGPRGPVRTREAVLYGDEAERESFKMVRYSAWLYFDGGKAKVSPDTLGIPRL